MGPRFFTYYSRDIALSCMKQFSDQPLGDAMGHHFPDLYDLGFCQLARSAFLSLWRNVPNADPYCVVRVFLRRAVFQVRQMVIHLVAVNVVNLKTARTRTNKSAHYQLVNGLVDSFPVARKLNSQVSIVGAVSLQRTICFPLSNAPQVGDFVIREGRNLSPRFRGYFIRGKFLVGHLKTPFSAWNRPVRLLAQSCGPTYILA